MQSGKVVWPWVLGVVVVGGAGTWLFRDQLQHLADGVAVPEQSAPTSAVAVPKPAATQEPAPSPIKHPLDSEAAADPALPNLADSDAAAWSTLSELFKGEGALTALLRDHLIQRLVTQVDNLDKASVPLPRWPSGRYRAACGWSRARAANASPRPMQRAMRPMCRPSLRSTRRRRPTRTSASIR